MARDVLATLEVFPRLGTGSREALRIAEEALGASMQVRSPGEAHRAVRSTLLAHAK
jgi:hypothetical protein